MRADKSILNCVMFHRNIRTGKMIDLITDAIDTCLYADSSKDAADVVQDYINNNFIYTDDQWTIIEYYQTPETANYREAEEQFTDELVSILTEYRQAAKEQ